MTTENKRSLSSKIRELRARIDEVNQRYGAGTKTNAAGTPPKQDFLHDLRKQRGKKHTPDTKSDDQTETSPGCKTDDVQPIVYHRALPRCQSGAGVRESGRGWGLSLEESVPGQELHHAQCGPAFCITTKVDSLHGAGEIDRRFLDAVSREESGLCQRLRRRCGKSVSVDDFMFMDIETCGLGNTPVFLIGVMVWEERGFEVRQFFARNYAEEVAIIGLFGDQCASRQVLVTFNGKSFDFPFIRNRAIVNGLRFDNSPAHFDMLHESRRVWRGKFPDCKLQTLELRVCGRARHGDIPGALIPEAYHAYVRTGNAWQITEILKHNLLDLITLADIMTRFPVPAPEKNRKRRQKKKASNNRPLADVI